MPKLRFAMVPAIIARRPNDASSRFLLGARAPISADLYIPIESPRLANPQSAKVAIVNERGSSTAFLRAKQRKRNQFIQRHTRAQQISNYSAVFPGNSDNPRNRRKHGAEYTFKAGREVRQPVRCSQP